MDKTALGKEQLQQKYQKERLEQDEQLPPYTSPPRGESSDPALRFPPQPHHTQAPSLSFKIVPKNLMSNTLLVVDANATARYTAKPSLFHSTMAITKCSSNEGTGTLVANVEYRTLRRKIELSFPHHHTITLSIKRLITETKPYASDALKGASLKWQSDNGFKSSVLQCSNENDVALAKITTSNWQLMNKSDFEFFGDISTNNPDIVDEIVATGLAMYYHVIRKRRTAAVGASAGAGA